MGIAQGEAKDGGGCPAAGRDQLVLHCNSGWGRSLGAGKPFKFNILADQRRGHFNEDAQAFAAPGKAVVSLPLLIRADLEEDMP